MKVLLIAPPYPVNEFLAPPLSLAYLAAVLEKNNIEVKILDFIVTKYSDRLLKQELKSFKPDLIGATCVTLSFNAAVRILRKCKRINKNIVTVIGGPHASFTAKEILAKSRWVDFVVIGEGEYSLLDLAKRVEEKGDIRKVNGIAYREGRKVIFTQPRELIDDLDSIPFPARHRLELNKYTDGLYDYSFCTIVTSRGCFGKCIFCVGPLIFGSKVRYRSPESVVDEMENIKRLGFKNINISDDTFTANHKHVHAVCELIKSRKLGIPWVVFARVDTVDKDLLLEMKSAGCIGVLYGVESGDPKVLENCKKGITVDQVMSAVRMTKEAGIPQIITSFIVGLPRETRDGLIKSLKLAEGLDSSSCFHFLSPYPGTQVYERANEYGIKILSKDYRRYDANFPPIAQNRKNAIKETIELMPLRMVDFRNNLGGYIFVIRKLSFRVERLLKSMLSLK